MAKLEKKQDIRHLINMELNDEEYKWFIEGLSFLSSEFDDRNHMNSKGDNNKHNFFEDLIKQCKKDDYKEIR
ncbi:MAG: hypothetical protein ACOCP8_01230 [archaeon]